MLEATQLRAHRMHMVPDTAARDGEGMDVLRVETREVPQTYPSLALPLSRVVPTTN